MGYTDWGLQCWWTSLFRRRVPTPGRTGLQRRGPCANQNEAGDSYTIRSSKTRGCPLEIQTGGQGAAEGSCQASAPGETRTICAILLWPACQQARGWWAICAIGCQHTCRQSEGQEATAGRPCCISANCPGATKYVTTIVEASSWDAAKSNTGRHQGCLQEGQSRASRSHFWFQRQLSKGPRLQAGERPLECFSAVRLSVWSCYDRFVSASGESRLREL